MSHSSNNKHLLIYPFSGSGHIIPLLDLTDLLLRRGFTITVIISATDLPLLDSLLSSHPSSLHKLVFPDPEINPLSNPFIAKIVSTQKLLDPIVKWFESHSAPPAAIISDFFLGWTTELATQLGIQRVVFSPSGALGSSVLHTFWRDVVNAQNDAGDDNFLISFPEIPNSPEYRWWQLSGSHEEEKPEFGFLREGFLANLRSWGIVYNTFEEMEGVYINYMKKQMGHDRVFALGPLLPDENSRIDSTARARGGPHVVPSNDLLTWLDQKANDSVVYISFGTLFSLSEKQMSVLAHALELSNVDFILCVKTVNIPSGFEDRVGDRGFIVKDWAPQLTILRHRAVGSFVTHCGWNSALEGVTAGVMMLMWPIAADQFGNAKLLVDQLGVGKRVCEDGRESVPDPVEFARLLNDSLSGDRLERVKVNELSQAATKAVKEGTSKRDLDMFVNLLSEL